MTKSEIELEIKKIGDDVGIIISYPELSALSESEKEDVISAYYAHDIDKLYDIVLKRQRLNELEDIADFLDKPYDELSQLPDDVIGQLCGIYLFEADSTPVNELRDKLNEIIDNNQ